MKRSELKKIKWHIKERTKTCPRCGAGYEYIEIRKVGSNFYVYFVHDTMRNKKRKVKKCYAGALQRYIYVEKFQCEAIERIRGLHDPERFFDYFIQLCQYFSDILAYQSTKLNVQQLERLRKRLEEILYLLDTVLSQNQ